MVQIPIAHVLLIDSEGNVPLWEAIIYNHEVVVRLLADNGATLSSGDVGQFSCIAAEQNNLNLLKKIIRHGGDITRSIKDGSTALHITAGASGILLIAMFYLVMHQYHLGTNEDEKDGEYVVSKIFFQAQKQQVENAIVVAGVEESYDMWNMLALCNCLNLVSKVQGSKL